jgi:hypothetical protein
MNGVTLFHPKLIMMSLGAVALLWPSPADSPVRTAIPAEPAPVRIEHQLIRINPPPPPQRPRPRVAYLVNRLADGKTPPAPPSRGLVVRAGRMLVGDGRYRPEPFPRPGR